MEEEEGGNAFDIAKKTQEKRFIPKSTISFERHEFRSMALEPTETTEQFLTQLRLKAEICEFDNINKHIRDQIIEKNVSDLVPRKLLVERRTLNLRRQPRSIEGICKTLSNIC